MNDVYEAIEKFDLYKVKGDSVVKMKKSELDSFRNFITHLIAAKKRNEVTELIVEKIKDKFKFYSIRDDDRKELWIYQDGIYVPNGATYVQEFCRIVLQDLYTTHICNEIVDKLRADSFVEHDFFFKQNYPELVVVENGILNIITKELFSFDQEKIFFNKLPVKYDQTAECPMIKQFLDDILEDSHDVQTIQEMFGDLLYGEYKYERCFMFLGDGRNGKSKLGDLIKRFIGTDSCCSVHPSTLEDPDSFTISHFFGKRANISLDINSTALRNISIIKSLSGRDIITAQRKFKTPIDFVNNALLIFGANELPRTFDTKNAFWERWILINFPFTFVNENEYYNNEQLDYVKLRDPSIIQKITSDEEMSGLLNFALEGLQSLQKNNCYTYKYTPEQVKSMWIQKSDSFAAFFLSYLEHDYDGKVRKKDLRKYYADFCRQNKLKTVSDKWISKFLTEHGISDDTHREEGYYENYWEGLKIKDEFAELDTYSFSQMKTYEGNKILSFDKKLIKNDRK